MGAMANRLKSYRGLLFPTAFVSVVLLMQIADAQVSIGGLNPPVNPFGDAGSATTERVQAYTYGIDAGVGETDNVTLVPTNKVSQTIATVDADFTVDKRSRVFDVNATGDFSDLDYLQNAYGNELLGRFDGVADADIVPGRLVWVLRDDFGQSALDPYTPVTPNNIENINYLTTGPDLKLRFGGINFIDLSARYGRAEYQTSPFNSNRFLVSGSVGRDISAGGSISLDVNTERVMFANTVVNSDFERSSGFGRYELRGSRTDLVAELGVTTVSQSGTAMAVLPDNISGTTLMPSEPGTSSASNPFAGSGSLTGPLAKLRLTRLISPSAKLILTAARDLTDASSSFSAQTTGMTGISTVTPAALSSNSYRMTYTSASWEYKRNRTTLTVTGRWEKDVYPGLPTLDATFSGANFTAERKLTRTFNVQLLGSWYKSDYPNEALPALAVGSTSYANTVVGTALTWRHGRGLEVRLRCSHDSYGVSNGNTGYHETRAFLTVGYRPLVAPPPEDVGAPQ
jgi:hypothetical protein